jgi:hypothetical protein
MHALAGRGSFIHRPTTPTESANTRSSSTPPSSGHHERKPHATAQSTPLFPGNSHGRARQPAIRRRLARLDAPASLWEDTPDTTIGDGARADGRRLLLRLSAWHLWPDRPDDAAEAVPA